MNTLVQTKDYLLKAWGADVAKCPAPDKIHDGAYYWWFASPEDRERFKAKLPYSSLVTSDEDPEDFSGNRCNTHKRTIAVMVFRLPSGEEKAFEYDFGYGYPAHSAEYMFEDGNYSCDCSRSSFLGLETMPCGETIQMVSFDIEDRD